GPGGAWMPMSSSMIVTEPLSSEQWEQIGWRGQEVLGDVAHSSVHAQRTADGRIAIGGRDAPQRFGAARSEAGATQPQDIAGLWRSLTTMFPGIVDVPVEHAWSGPLGVTRDGVPTVQMDRSRGLGWAGGYSGSGVASGHLAGRTRRDLVLGRSTALTRLPWVGHEVSDPHAGWEPRSCAASTAPLTVVSPRAPRGRDILLAWPVWPRAFPVAETGSGGFRTRSEEHTAELQSRLDLVCRLLLEEKKRNHRL